MSCGQVERDVDELIGRQSRGFRPKFPKAADEQTRAGQPNHGQRHLATTSARRQRPPLVAVPREAARRLVDRCRPTDVMAGRSAARTADTRASATLAPMTRASTRIASARGSPSGTHRMRTGKSAPVATSGQRADADRQHEALRKNLSHEPRTSGPQRGAHGELGPAGVATHQQQTRHVGARNQQHQSHGREQDEHRWTHVADDELAIGLHLRHEPTPITGWPQGVDGWSEAPQLISHLCRGHLRA